MNYFLIFYSFKSILLDWWRPGQLNSGLLRVWLKCLSRAARSKQRSPRKRAEEELPDVMDRHARFSQSQMVVWDWLEERKKKSFRSFVSLESRDPGRFSLLFSARNTPWSRNAMRFRDVIISRNITWICATWNYATRREGLAMSSEQFPVQLHKTSH